MFYSVKNNEEDLDRLRDSLNSSFGHTAHSFASLYRMNTPFRLMVRTMHPDNDENYYTITIIDPSTVVYATSEKKDIQSFPAVLHQHDFYEFLFVLDGEMYQNIENQRHRYPAGSCCLLNRKVRHCEEHSTDYRVVYLDISPKMMNYIYSFFSVSYFPDDNLDLPPQLNEFFSKDRQEEPSNTRAYIDFIPRQNHDWQIKHVHQTFETLIRESLEPKAGSTFRIHQQIFQLFLTLADKSAYTTTPVSIGTTAGNILFDQITQLMSIHHGRLTRREIEEALNYSGTYLNYITQNYTGLSLLDYGMLFCMKRVAYLLIETTQSIADIAAELGFSNRTQFYKKFEAYYHMTPAQYRKEKKRL